MINFGKLFHSKLKKALIVNLTVIAAVCVYYAILLFLDISCPIKLLLGFDCPTCGSTTAVLCLLKGDFQGYLNKPFSLPLLVAIALEINKPLFKKPVIIDIYAITVAAGNLVYYLVTVIF